MKKILIYIFIVLFILVANYTIIFPQITYAGIGDWFTIGDIGKSAIENASGIIGNVIMTLVSKVLWIAGILLNYSLKWTLNISTLVAQIPAITLAWKTVRDFATMFFIFLIIYQAISMILGLDGLGTKKLLVNIVIAGLLINFSLFFTKIIIDASNIVALQFYNAMTPNAEECADGCLSDVFMQQLWIQTTLDYNQPTQLAGGAPTGIDNKHIFTTTIMGSIVMLVAAFVFFAAAVLFAIRIVVLIILMALSPLAYVSGVLPGTKSYADQWWSTLHKQAIFAPAYLLVTYIGIRILSDPTFKKVLNGGSDVSPTFNQAFSGGAGTGASSVVVILNFLIVIIFLIAGLIIADKLGVQGASTLKGWGQSLRKMGQGFVGRNTVGRVGHSLDKALENTSFGNSVAGRSLRQISTGALASAKFGSSKSRIDSVKQGKDVATKQRIIDRVKDLKVAMATGNATAVKDALDKMSTKEKAQLDTKTITNPLVTQHLGKGELDEIEKGERSEADKITIKNAKRQLLINAIGSGDSTTVKNIISKMTGKEIVSLGTPNFTNPIVVSHLKTSQVKDMEDLAFADRRALATLIPVGHSAYGYVNSPGARGIWY
ncbi:MAG: hypothetical protein NUV47_01535 [Patescibacteria group bacterium]|nr:hypothetical protein [Patescibacteria group bacterium]